MKGVRSVASANHPASGLSADAEVATIENAAAPASCIPRAACMALFALACVGSFAKGKTPAVHLDELYFWLNSYAHGYVRRGLIGTLLLPLTDSAAPAWLLRALFVLHLVSFAGLAILAFRLAVPAGRRDWPLRSLLIALVFACSPFMTQLAHHAGYPDDLIALFLCSAAILLPRANGPAVAALLLASCCMHELCFLLLLPLVMFSLALRTRPAGGVIAWVGLSVAVAILLPLVTQPPGPWLPDRLVQFGLTAQEAQHQVHETLVRSVPGWLSVMAGIWRHDYVNAGIGLAYAVVPGLLILLLAAPRARLAILARTPHPQARRALTGLYIASGLAGCGLLLLALDLSRIVSFTTLTALLTTTMLPADAGNRPAGKQLAAASCLCALLYALAPAVDLHFAFGRVLNLVRVSSVCPACAAAGVSFIDFYDRRLSPDAVQRMEKDPALGN